MSPCHYLCFLPGLLLFSWHRITQGEDFSELLDDIQQRLCQSVITILGSFCFTTLFVGLDLPLLDLQGASEPVTTRDVPGSKSRWLLDVRNCFPGRNGRLEVVLPGEIAPGLSTSSVESLGRYQRAARVGNRTASLPLSRAVLMWDRCPPQVGSGFLLANSPSSITSPLHSSRGAHRALAVPWLHDLEQGSILLVWLSCSTCQHPWERGESTSQICGGSGVGGQGRTCLTAAVQTGLSFASAIDFSESC